MDLSLTGAPVNDGKINSKNISFSFDKNAKAIIIQFIPIEEDSKDGSSG